MKTTTRLAYLTDGFERAGHRKMTSAKFEEANDLVTSQTDGDWRWEWGDTLRATIEALKPAKSMSASGAAWRGRYVYNSRNTLIAAIIFDPYPTSPCLRIRAPKGFFDSVDGTRVPKIASIRIPLPTIQYRPNMGPIRTRLYSAVQRFWLSLDGRRPR